MDWLTFKITLAIRLSLQIYHEKGYVKWAQKWLSGEDRSSSSAYAAYAASADAATSAANSSIMKSIKKGAKLELEVKFL